MQEAFLHHIWQYKKFQLSSLASTSGEEIQLIHSGQYNTNSGPDFLNAQVRIGGQHWAGNVEIHLKSSDWYVHNHEEDSNYDNVILHVVWQHDVEVFQKGNIPIPTLELKNLIDPKLLNSYHNLLGNNHQFINCEKNIADVPEIIVNNWIETLFIERLQQKTEPILALLSNSNNDWEAVLFCMLFKAFGLNVNGEAFLEIAKSTKFSIIRKLHGKHEKMEALFLGQAKLLVNNSENSYQQQLSTNYSFLKNKFKLENNLNPKPDFFRLRPTNFPTIRLSQLATIYTKEPSLFNKLMNCKELQQYYDLLKVSPSLFWQSHYTFEKISKKSHKATTKSFIDLLIINAIIPLRFTYHKILGNDDSEQLINLISEIKREKNSVVDKFNTLRDMQENALQSQSILQLKSQYCDKNRCLHCAIGNSLLSHN